MDGELQRTAYSASASHIVVVSADAAFRQSTALFLRNAGYSCRTVDSLAGVLDTICVSPPSLAIVEGAVGPWRAANFCLELGKHADFPLLAVDYSSDVLDRILALEMGADEYLSHPVNEREVLARIKALLRRSDPPPHARPSSPVADRPVIWRLELAGRRLVGPCGLSVLLSAADQRLLLELVRQAGTPFQGPSKREHSLGISAPNQLRVAIKRLRRKLGSVGFQADTIQNVRSLGYMFDARVARQGEIVEPAQLAVRACEFAGFEESSAGRDRVGSFVVDGDR